MLLSEAIRLGSMLRPRQSFTCLFDPSEPDASCALGAAAEAVGLLDTTRRDRYVKGMMAPKEWRWTRVPRECPSCHGRYRDSTDILMVHLNTSHKWTREHIAEWVATVEPPQEPQAIGEAQSRQTSHELTSQRNRKSHERR